MAVARDGSAEFWQALRAWWRAPDADREYRAVRAALVHLRRRLPGWEAAHVEAALPEGVRALWSEPEPERTRLEGRPLERYDARHFFEAVRADAGLADTGEAERVTVAVLAALARFLDRTHRDHVANCLPAGLKEPWYEVAGLFPGAPPRRARPPGGGR